MLLHLLVIDDSEDHQKVVFHLFSRQFQLAQAKSLAEADHELAKNSFHLILLDVHLPDGDGFSYFAKLQTQDHTRDIPVMFVTAAGETPKEVMGLSLGAEDYIVKPIDPPRLRARVEAKIRQLALRQEKELVLQKGNLKLVVAHQRASMMLENREVPVNLTPVEFKLLFHFVRSEDQVFSREQLLRAVWGDSTEVYDRTVDMHISNLRKKILNCEHEIQAVPRVGYRFSRIKNEEQTASQNASSRLKQ